jgi:hypothetical protein
LLLWRWTRGGRCSGLLCPGGLTLRCGGGWLDIRGKLGDGLLNFLVDLLLVVVKDIDFNYCVASLNPYLSVIPALWLFHVQLLSW